MAAEVDKKEESTAPAKKGKGLLIAIIAVAVIGAAAGAYFIFGGKKSAPAAEGHGEQAEASSHEAPSGAPGEAGAKEGGLFNLEPFIVNLQDNSGTRYLKLTINLELTEGASAADLTAQATQIRDSLIILLSSKSYTDIGTVEGKYLMRDEIVARVNQFLKKGKVKTAYFTEFVIQ
ncbi:MAG: flagellar basal body-associated FliL family protein [Deltaproteobacteria bacterium]|nr:flagellar basal body-associated FliL family protein [Deltaproteobacteria bacterium]